MSTICFRTRLYLLHSTHSVSLSLSCLNADIVLKKNLFKRPSSSSHHHYRRRSHRHWMSATCKCYTFNNNKQTNNKQLCMYIYNNSNKTFKNKTEALKIFTMILIFPSFFSCFSSFFHSTTNTKYLTNVIQRERDVNLNYQ